MLLRVFVLLVRRRENQNVAVAKVCSSALINQFGPQDVNPKPQTLNVPFCKKAKLSAVGKKFRIYATLETQQKRARAL